MKKYLFALMLIALVPGPGRCRAQATDSAVVVHTLVKCWRTIAHEFSDIYGLDDEDVKRFSKQRICFTPDSIKMYNNVLYDPKFLVKKVNSEDYARKNFDCSKQRLSIVRDSVYEITISSLTKPGDHGKVHKMTDVIAFDEECIFVVVDGVIFKLIDADTKAEGRSSN